MKKIFILGFILTVISGTMLFSAPPAQAVNKCDAPGVCDCKPPENSPRETIAKCFGEGYFHGTLDTSKNCKWRCKFINSSDRNSGSPCYGGDFEPDPGGSCDVPPASGSCGLDDDNQTPPHSDACVTCITGQDSRLITDAKNLGKNNGQNWDNCSNQVIVNWWCNGGAGSPAYNTCKGYKDGACFFACRSFHTIGGKIVDNNGQPLKDTKVEVYYNIPTTPPTFGHKTERTTGADGKFKVENVLKTGYGYSVRIPVPQSGITSATQIKTTTDGWAFRNHSDPAKRIDNPLNSASYEFQEAGNNDCSGPAGTNSQDTLRCNFKIEASSTTRDTSGPATACNGNVASQGNGSSYALWNGQCNGALQAGGTGIGQGCCELACGADAQCDEQTAGQGSCNTSCKVTTQTTPTIGGRVVDEEGQGVNGVKVWIRDESSTTKYRGVPFKSVTTSTIGGVTGKYSAEVAIGSIGYWVRVPNSDAKQDDGTTPMADGVSNDRLFSGGTKSTLPPSGVSDNDANHWSYESQAYTAANKGCQNDCNFTVTLLRTSPPVVYPTKVRIANSEAGLALAQSVELRGARTPTNPLVVDWTLEDSSGQPQKVYIQFGFGTDPNIRWDSRVYSSEDITYTFESGSCECGATNLCASSCQFTKLVDINYTNPVKCSLNTRMFVTLPDDAAYKSSWCQRRTRTLGDADGDNVINAIDYTYYIRAVNNGKIPFSVNPDFSGDGHVGVSESESDLTIWQRGKGMGQQ